MFQTSIAKIRTNIIVKEHDISTHNIFKNNLIPFAQTKNNCFFISRSKLISLLKMF